MGAYRDIRVIAPFEDNVSLELQMAADLAGSCADVHVHCGEHDDGHERVSVHGDREK